MGPNIHASESLILHSAIGIFAADRANSLAACFLISTVNIKPTLGNSKPALPLQKFHYMQFVILIALWAQAPTADNFKELT